MNLLLKNSLIIVLLLSCFSVYASEPSYTITHSLNSSLQNKQQEIGSIVFTKGPYTNPYFNISNFSSYTTEQYNTLFWKGNSSIVVVKPDTTQALLIPNQGLILDQDGHYSYHLVLNSSIIGNIVSNTASQDYFKLTHDEIDGVDVNFSIDEFFLNTEKIVKINLSIDDDIVPKNYNISFYIDSNRSIDQNITFNFTVKENRDWVVINDTLNETIVYVKSGSITPLGSLKLKNIGNIDFDVGLKLSGNASDLLLVPDNQTLFKKSSSVFNVQIQIPSIQEVGQYVATIEFMGGNKTLSKTLLIVVQDSQIPEIEKITFSSDSVFIPTTITAIAKDNIGVEKLTFSFEGKTYTMVKDEQVFTYVLNFSRLSRYVITFCAFDDSNNSDCVDINKTFERLDIVNNSNSSITLPSRKYGSFSRVKLFDYVQEIPEGISVQLIEVLKDDINATNDFQVRIIDGKGAIKRFTTTQNFVTIEELGPIYLEVRNDGIVDYDGYLEFFLPEYAVQVGTISFSGRFLDYDVPQAFVMDWFGETLSCDVVDTGDLKTSYYDCQLILDISTDKDDIPVPTSVSERRQLDREINETTMKYEEQKKKYSIIITLGLSLFVFFGVMFYYIMFVRPISRVKFNKPDED